MASDLKSMPPVMQLRCARHEMQARDICPSGEDLLTGELFFKTYVNQAFYEALVEDLKKTFNELWPDWLMFKDQIKEGKSFMVAGSRVFPADKVDAYNSPFRVWGSISYPFFDSSVLPNGD